MIYDQDFIFYILSILTTIVIGFRLHTYLKEFFSSGYSVIVTLTILLHPLSIDMFLAPNFISGSLAFYFFLESLFLLKKEKYTWTIVLAIIATACNFAYCLFPIYFFLKNIKKLKKYYFPALLYFVLLLTYLNRNELSTNHNPFIFFSYFSLNILLPLSLNIFDYSLFPFSASTIVFTIVFLLLLIWRQQSNSSSMRFWPILFLPIIGTIVHQWTETYYFWNEVLLSPSSFICITFALIVMLAIHLPKKIFIVYFVFILLFSLDWALLWNPYSKLLKQSIIELPADFHETLTAKRVLAWQYLYEKNTKDGEALLKDLLHEDPLNEVLKKDLEILKKDVK